MADAVQQWASERVHQCYWQDDWNCARTQLVLQCEAAQMPLPPLWAEAMAGLHGAGGYGAQCGLVEGMLLFLGLQGALSKESAEEISARCRNFAAAFETRFGSLLCRELRPQGFPQDGPSHACEALTTQAIAFARQWLLAENLQGKID